MLMPGFSSAPPAPVVQAAPPPPPERDDPAVIEARKKLKSSQLRRKGRGASIFSGGAGVLGEAPVTRPAAAASLGG